MLGSEGCIRLEYQILITLHRFEPLTLAGHRSELSLCGFACLLEGLELGLELVQGHGLHGEHLLIPVTLALELDDLRSPRPGLRVRVAVGEVWQKSLK